MKRKIKPGTRFWDSINEQSLWFTGRMTWITGEYIFEDVTGQTWLVSEDALKGLTKK